MTCIRFIMYFIMYFQSFNRVRMFNAMRNIFVAVRFVSLAELVAEFVPNHANSGLVAIARTMPP